MEFTPRNSAPAPVAPQGRRKRFDWNGRAVRIEWFVFTTLVAILLLFVIGWSIFSNGSLSYSESDQIQTSKYQAVFLNGGATSGSVAYTTYFGHVTKLTDKYVILKDVYYLTTSSTGNDQVQPQLTKLGCQQLHSPYDEMVINRNQVAFWENLKDNGKVVEAIKLFIQKNPNGPDCSAASPSTGTSNTNSGSSSTSTQNSGTTTR